MKRVVFLVGSYYPKYSATGKCIGNIADAISQKHCADVISWATGFDEVANDKYYYNNQTIYRTYDRAHYWYLRLLHGKQSNLGISGKVYSLLWSLVKLWRFLRVLINDSSINRSVFKAYRANLADIGDDIDVIIPTCLSFETVLAAIDYKKHHPPVKIIPILFDEFANNINLARGVWSRNFKLNKNIEIEQEMFEKSEAVLYVRNWREHIREHFPQYSYKSIEIEHPLLREYRSNDLCADIFDSSRINMVYAGSVSENDRNPREIIYLLRSLKLDKLCVHFFANGNARYIIDNAAKHRPSLFKSYGYVAHSVVVDALGSADILISIGNTISGQIPSKIFEYISYGKPIIHFVYVDGDPVIDVLSKYGLGKIVKVSECKNPQTWRSVEQFILSNYKKSIAYEEVVSIFANATPEYTANIIDKIIYGRNM